MLDLRIAVVVEEGLCVSVQTPLARRPIIAATMEGLPFAMRADISFRSSVVAQRPMSPAPMRHNL